MSSSLSFCTAKFFVNDLPEKLYFFISNSLHNQLFSPLGFISQWIRLVKFHPMGLELNTSFKKSSVSILHFPFSSVQFRLRFRWLCLSCAFSFFDVVWKVKCDDDTSCYTTSMMSHLSVQLCAHHCLHHENSDASRLPRSGSKLKANSSLERTQGTVHALWSLVSHSCTWCSSHWHLNTPPQNSCRERVDLSTKLRMSSFNLLCFICWTKGVSWLLQLSDPKNS